MVYPARVREFYAARHWVLPALWVHMGIFSTGAVVGIESIGTIIAEHDLLRHPHRNVIPLRGVLGMTGGYRGPNSKAKGHIGQPAPDAYQLCNKRMNGAG